VRGNIYYLFRLLLLIVVVGWVFTPVRVWSQSVNNPDSTNVKDTSRVNLIYPFNDFTGNPYLDKQTSPLYLKNPSNINQEIIYNPKTKTYEFVNKIGDFIYRTPTTMSFEDYKHYKLKEDINSYWKERSQMGGTAEGNRLIPKIYVGGKAFETIFGSNTIDIRPQGSAEISFGVLVNKRDDPALDFRQMRITSFDFNESIQMNVIAKIGDKIEFKANYNTESSFNFENTLKLKYEGDEDEIIKLIEAGNVNLPLRSSLIRGSQSLFGVKTILQFGKTTITAVYSEQQSETKNIRVEGGKQANRFELKALDYEENRHFFLAQKFRDNYEPALADLPIISSDIVINKVEVWVTNIGPSSEENRNIIAFTDLGENSAKDIYNRYVQPIPGMVFPSNLSNDMLFKMDTTQLRDINAVSQYLSGDPFNIGQSSYFVAGEDYVKLENARKLDETEYTINTKLGFISLNTSVSDDQVVAVAVQYTVIGSNQVYQIGEFSDQGVTAPNCLIVKLLKSNVLNTDMPMWNLMMKNVYSIGAYQVQSQDFIFNVLYSGNNNSVPTGYFMEGPNNVKGVPLIHLLNVDNLDNQLNPIPGGDGVFDFLDGAGTDGGTIESRNGRLFFPVLEPFGKFIHDSIFPDNPELADKYSYDSLYTMTKAAAEQFPDKNRYILEGYYQSSSGSEISLNALNVPQGSVSVTAGGVPLVENVDYTVDYTLGRVRIINDGILNSGTPINVSLESNSMFAVQKKRMMGLHVDQEITKDFHIGGTILNLHERPLTQKVNYGDDPISNTIWGMDFSYRYDSRWLTNIIDKLPGISTNVVSRLQVDAEFAQFLPGHAKVIGNTGTSYIDDFEGASSTIDLKYPSSWFLASTPQGQPDMFPEANSNSLDYGVNRASLAWYIIDPSIFYSRSAGLRPPNIDLDEVSKNSTRQVLETEVFPNKDIPNGRPTTIPVLNLAYYPEERGPYNFDTDKINENGLLEQPETRWGGIMRKIETSDFEAANIEYIEFWMMDPFTEDFANNTGGDIYLNLGEISEDILKDGRKSYENGLPVSNNVENVDTTVWGRVPNLQALVESFSNAAGSRQYQDVGYDGLGSEFGNQDEYNFYKDEYVDVIKNRFGVNSQAYLQAVNDPSADDYHYFRGTDYDENIVYSSVLERYKRYNGVEGNSPTDDLNPENYPIAQSNTPNVEDINRDNTLSETERYFQYHIKLDPDEMKVGENNIADIQLAKNVRLANGEILDEVKWYQFRIPVTNPSKIIGNINDFRSIRFMRLFMRGFEQPIVLRFATFDLIRSEWRRYKHSLLAAGDYIPSDDASETRFVLSTVNIEENSRRTPIPYVVPPGIERETNFATTDYVQLNEQSLQFDVIDLQDGDARGTFKTTDFDFRQFKKIKMFIHGEKRFKEQELNYGDIKVFVRIGADLTNNYYEYEMPIRFTPWGTTAYNPDEIWPVENEMEIVLDDIVEVKKNRNLALNDPNSGVSLNKPYVENVGNATITVVGNPSISDVKGILIGVRNPKRVGSTLSDDGQPKSVIVWVDELRLTDFNDKSSWATTGRLQADLADLARVSLMGSYSGAGFGTIDQKINQLSLDYQSSMQVATDIDWGKFFPKNSGVRIPMHFDYGFANITPKYDPLNPDVLLKDDLKTYVESESRDSIKELTIDHTTRTNVNVMNVRKERVNRDKKPRGYDVENFDVSFAYSKLNHRNIDIEQEEQKRYQGGIGYNYNMRPNNVQPLKNVKFLSKSNYLQLIRDFNFYYLPKLISVRTDMTRNIMRKQLRDKSFGDIITYPTYERIWNWNRDFIFKYDFAKSLSFEFSSHGLAFVEEPMIIPDKETPEWDQYKKYIWNSIWNFGSMQNFNQIFRAIYNVPLNKIPIIDWLRLTASYQGIYSWLASPRSIQMRFGNVIENSNDVQFNGSADLVNFYNKIGYLRNLNKPARRGSSSRNNNKSQKDKSKKTKAKKDDNSQDSTNIKPKVNYAKIIGDGILRTIMVVRSVSLNYRDGNGTSLPGFMPLPNVFGYSFTENAPTVGFIFGSQKDIRADAATLGWITTDTVLNNPYIQKHTEQLNYSINLDLWNLVKINVDGDRIFNSNYQAYYRYDPLTETYREFSPVQGGNFSISYNTIKTSFGRKVDSISSPTFDQFKSYRKTVAFNLARNNPNWTENDIFYDSLAQEWFPIGYSSNQQEVMYYSFLAAYGGRDVNKMDLSSPFSKFPFPNWTINVNGLINIPFIKNTFRSFNVKSSYRSVLGINSWRTNLIYNPKDPYTFYPDSYNYVNQYDVGVVTIMEDFSPLVGVDFTMKNSLNARFEYRKSRALTMSFVNNQLTEVHSNEIAVGVGYRIKNLSFVIATNKSSKRFSSDLNIKADVGYRNNVTYLRRIDENNNQLSSGSKQFTFNFSADYMLSQSLQMRLYVNYNNNSPYITAQVPTASTSAGISLRFNLAQ
jgi:cell surface protein SprA